MPKKEKKKQSETEEEVPCSSPEESNAYKFADNMLQEAVTDFEDENSKVPFDERISGLRNALIWGAFTDIKMTQKYGADSIVRQARMEKHSQMMKSFAEIEKLYASQLRANKLSGKRDDSGLNNNFLKKIKAESKSTVGSVVRNLNE